MKKMVVTLIVCMVSTMPLQAQHGKGNDIDFIMDVQYNRYAAGWGKMINFVILFPVSERWCAGLGMDAEWVYSGIEPRGGNIPYNNLTASRMDIGLSANAQYLLGNNKRSRHSLLARLTVALSGVSITAEDVRAEHIVSDGEFEYTTCEYSITPAHEDQWGPRYQITPQISYAYDLGWLHLECGIGYNLIDPIRQEYRTAPTALSSDWSDFNKYYPKTTVNPFEEWNCGRKIGKMNGGYVSLAIGINTMKVDDDKKGHGDSRLILMDVDDVCYR